MGEVLRTEMSLDAVSNPPNPSTGQNGQALGAGEVRTDRPAWLPEKFKSPEEMASEYTALASRPNVGEMISKAAQEYSAGGAVTPATLAALESAGISKQYIDDYAYGQSAARTAQASEIYGLAGGEENYTQMVKWAATNLQPDQAKAYNEAVQSKDFARAKQAATALVSAYRQSNGVDPQQTVGGSSRGVGPQPYRDMSEFKEAIKDPRYSKSEAYRAEVAQRISISNLPL